jgi:hypothetical protein
MASGYCARNDRLSRVKMGRRYLGVIVVATVVAIVFGVASDERGMVFVQKWCGVPAKRLPVGTAEFQRSDRWLLIASRESRHQSIRLFGFFPSWFAVRRFASPSERFYTFRLVDDPDRPTVTFIEEDWHTSDTVAEIVTRKGLTKDAVISSSLTRRKFHGYDALEVHSPSASVIYVPELRVTIVVEPRSSAAESAISITQLR